MPHFVICYNAFSILPFDKRSLEAANVHIYVDLFYWEELLNGREIVYCLHVIQILVPLPEPEARQAMFEELLPSKSGEELPYDLLVEKTEGYSGSDLRLLCKEAAMQPLRRLMASLEETPERVPEDGMFFTMLCLLLLLRINW